MRLPLPPLPRTSATPSLPLTSSFPSNHPRKDVQSRLERAARASDRSDRRRPANQRGPRQEPGMAVIGAGPAGKPLAFATRTTPCSPKQVAMAEVIGSPRSTRQSLSLLSSHLMLDGATRWLLRSLAPPATTSSPDRWSPCETRHQLRKKKGEGDHSSPAAAGWPLAPWPELLSSRFCRQCLSTPSQQMPFRRSSPPFYSCPFRARSCHSDWDGAIYSSPPTWVC